MTKEFNQEKFKLCADLVREINHCENQIQDLKNSIVYITALIANCENPEYIDPHSARSDYLEIKWSNRLNFPAKIYPSEVKALLNAMRETNKNKLSVATEELNDLKRQFAAL